MCYLFFEHVIPMQQFHTIPTSNIIQCKNNPWESLLVCLNLSYSKLFGPDAPGVVYLFCTTSPSTALRTWPSAKHFALRGVLQWSVENNWCNATMNREMWSQPICLWLNPLPSRSWVQICRNGHLMAKDRQDFSWFRLRKVRSWAIATYKERQPHCPSSSHHRKGQEAPPSCYKGILTQGTFNDIVTSSFNFAICPWFSNSTFVLGIIVDEYIRLSLVQKRQVACNNGSIFWRKWQLFEAMKWWTSKLWSQQIASATITTIH